MLGEVPWTPWRARAGGSNTVVEPIEASRVLRLIISHGD